MLLLIWNEEEREVSHYRIHALLSAPARYLSTTVIPRWMRIAYVVFGLTFVAIGISWLVKGNGNSASGGIQVAIGVGWLLVAALKGRQSVSHSKPEHGAA